VGKYVLSKKKAGERGDIEEVVIPLSHPSRLQHAKNGLEK